MRKDDWIVQLYIKENIMKKTNKTEVPIQLGWLKPKSFNDNGLPVDYDVDMVDNIDNLTDSQCLSLADVISKETKKIDRVMSDEEFQKKFYL